MPLDFWAIFAQCFVLGLVAFTLPCIFPLAPLTVSYFTQRAGKGARVWPMALAYAAAIVVIYVALGLLVSLLFGAGALNELASDGWFNLFVFAVLLLFGLSLLGCFEMNLPSSWVNAIAARSYGDGLAGIFFLAATLAVVSFSCTGPVIGGILVSVGVQAGMLAPLVAMLGFSSALAAVFFGFAVAPQYVHRLPRSGHWMQDVKVTLGFLEIGLALKFLSTADLAYHWGLLSRERFVAIWIALAVLYAAYVLEVIPVWRRAVVARSWLRIAVALASLLFALVLARSYWGAPLHFLSGFLPPETVSLAQKQKQEQSLSFARKYGDLFSMPHGIPGFFDVEQAMQVAQLVGKPVLLDFTGHGCVNCRKMEAEVWSDARILPLLKESYIVVSLYTDDKTALPEAERVYSPLLKTEINTIGKKFKQLQAQRYQTISQPYYVLLDTRGELLVSPPIGVELDVESYRAYLLQGLQEFTRRSR